MLFHEHSHDVIYSSTMLMCSDLRIQTYCLVLSGYPSCSCYVFLSHLDYTSFNEVFHSISCYFCVRRHIQELKELSVSGVMHIYQTNKQTPYIEC